MDERVQALYNAAEQFRAAFRDGNAAELLEYFDEIFEEALKPLAAESDHPTSSQ